MNTRMKRVFSKVKTEIKWIIRKWFNFTNFIYLFLIKDHQNLVYIKSVILMLEVQSS
jgi:hypothetical protein